MPASLNGGANGSGIGGPNVVPLADASVTEWRLDYRPSRIGCIVPLADASVTEWRFMLSALSPRAESATR